MTLTIPYSFGKYTVLYPLPSGQTASVAADTDGNFVNLHFFEIGKINQQILLQLASISHPNISQVHDVGLANKQLYLIEDHTEGLSLGFLAKKTPLSRDICLYIVATLSSVLYEFSATLPRIPLPSFDQIYVSAEGHIFLSLTALLAPPSSYSSLLAFAALLQRFLPVDGTKDEFSTTLGQMIEKIKSHRISNFQLIHIELTQLLRRCGNSGFMVAQLAELVEKVGNLPQQQLQLQETAIQTLASKPANLSPKIFSFYQPTTPLTSSHNMTMGRDTEQLLPGTAYKLVRKLGSGGMGVIFEAEHTELKRHVAIKVLHSNFSRDPQMLSRFKQEARAVARIRHPYIVEIYDFGTTRTGEAFLAMELLQGQGLDVLCQNQRFSVNESLTILLQLTEGLQAAHQAGIIHCDLKPDNIMLIDAPMAIESLPETSTPPNTLDYVDIDIEFKKSKSSVANIQQKIFVKILDFGIAKLRDPNQLMSCSIAQQGHFFGTPEYISPEQIRGEKVDARTDVYSLGCMAYELLVGKPPFVRESHSQILMAHLHEKPLSLQKQSPTTMISDDLEALVLKAIQKDPAARFSSMAEFHQVLLECLYGTEGKKKKLPTTSLSFFQGISKKFTRRFTQLFRK